MRRLWSEDAAVDDPDEQRSPGSVPERRPTAALRLRRSLEALQYFETLEVLAGLARTDVGRRDVLALRPGPGCDLRRRRYSEIERLLQERSALVASWEEPLQPLLDKLGDERSEVDARDVLAAGRLVVATTTLIAELTEDGALEAEVAEVRAEEEEEEERDDTLEPLAALAEKISRVLDARGRIRDDASPRLGRLRRQGAQAPRRSLRDPARLHQRAPGRSGGRHDHASRRPAVGPPLVRSRGRMQGLIHGRSGTGRSYYFEPLEVVEANNSLQAASAEEEAERARLLRELEQGVRSRAAALARRAELLAIVDSLQAAAHFAERSRSVLPQLGSARVVLDAARHPLLEPRLASLREATLGPQVEVEHLVPLSLDFGDDAVIVVTGPNAGGKTVALKTLGLLTAMAHAGLPVPAAEATSLPEVCRLVAAVGDEQSLLEGRSTFSAQLLGLKSALEAAEPGAMILLDEVGSGTNPEEGAAIACALLEELVSSGCTALITTHLIQVASRAAELEGARGMAMEFDSGEALPTYQLTDGAPGGSHALELAERLELPESLLRRADELLGSEHRKLRALIAETEELRQSLLEREQEVEREIERQQEQREELEESERRLDEERRKLRGTAERQIEAFRTEIRSRLEAEETRLKAELEGGRRKDLAGRATKRLFEAVRPELPAAPEPRDRGIPKVGDDVRHRALGWRGRLDALDGERAVVLARGKRLQCRIGELERIAAVPAESKKRAPRVTVPSRDDSSAEINLIGRRVEEALADLDAYLDHALVGGLERVRVIHGHGSGRLRNAVREFLKSHPSVVSHAPAGQAEGGNGATVAKLRGV